MKKSILCITALALSAMIFAQQDPLQGVFEKYTGKDGYIAITLTGDMLKMAAQMQEYRRDTTLASELDEVKILVQEKSPDQTGVNFYKELYGLISKSGYKELMTVMEEDQNVAMLARESDGIITEFILLVGGDDDNVVIQAKGSILLRELAELTGNMNFKGFEQMRQLGK